MGGVNCRFNLLMLLLPNPGVLKYVIIDVIVRVCSPSVNYSKVPSLAHLHTK